MQYKAKVDKKYMEYLHERAEQSKIQRHEQEARAARVGREGRANWRQMGVLRSGSGSNMQSPGAKPMKSSPFAKRGRGVAGLKPSASGAASSASLGHSVAGLDKQRDYATIAQLKAVARALQPGGPGKQQAKLKASFIEQKNARGELLGATRNEKGPAGRQGLATEIIHTTIHQLMAANAVQAPGAGNIKAR